MKAFAQEESGASGYNAWSLASVYRTLKERHYPENVFPNLFISNHDLWRFGNLIRSKYGIGPEKDEYWKRHKITIASLCAYSGPITIYYGDEYGDITEKWYSPQHHFCGSLTASDNCARTNGRITGFNNNEQDLIFWTANCMKIRRENPALWRGTNKVVVSEDVVLVNYKTDKETNNSVIFIVNLDVEKRSVDILIPDENQWTVLNGRCTFSRCEKDKEKHEEKPGNYKITLDPLTCCYIKLE